MNLIEEARLDKKISQAELARRSEFSKSYISKLESGKKIPSNEAIKKIAHVLNVCPISLYIYFYLNDICECKRFKDNDSFCCNCKYHKEV